MVVILYWPYIFVIADDDPKRETMTAQRPDAQHESLAPLKSPPSVDFHIGL